MSSFTVHVVCQACAPQVAAISPITNHIARFLLPLSAPAISNAVATGRESLALFLLNTLSSEPTLHDLDKRLRARLMMPAAASAGSIAVMEVILNRFDCRIDASIVREGVRGGHREAVEWLYSQVNFPEDHLLLFPTDLVAIPASNGDLDMLESLLEMVRAVSNRSGRSSDFHDAPKLAACVATRHSHNSIVDWLRPRFELPGEFSLANERHTGPLQAESPGREACRQCRERLRFNHPTRVHCTGWRMDHVAARGRLDDVQWFFTDRPGHCFSPNAVTSAVANGHLNVVQWLHENVSKLEISTSAMNSAAADGHLEVIQWIYEHGDGRCTEAAMEKAAANGHLSVLRFLANAAGVRAASRALIVDPAHNGHLDVVQWLLMEYNRAGMAGIPGLTSFTARAIDAAASRGHMDMVQFLFANAGSSCVASALAEAAGNNHKVVVTWLLQQYRSECLATVESVHFSPTTRSRSRQRGSHVAHTIQSAAMNGHLDMVQLLYDFERSHNGSNGSCEVLHKAFISAAGHGHLTVAKWLFQLLTDDESESIALGTTLADALYLTVGGSSVLVLDWLCNHPELPAVLRLRAIDSSSLVIGFNNAAGSADFAMLKWVCSQRLSVDFKTAKMCATNAGMEEVVTWLEQAEEEHEASIEAPQT